MAPISLNEEMLGYSDTEVFIPNLISCSCVAIKLTNGFIGMHITPSATPDELKVAANYAASNLVRLGGAIEHLVFFVNSKEWGKDEVANHVKILKDAFNKKPTIREKPDYSAAQPSIDVWLHKPVQSNSSWMGTRPHNSATGVEVVNPKNNHVLKVNSRTKPPSIVVAPIQTLPKDRTPGSFQNI